MKLINKRTGKTLTELVESLYPYQVEVIDEMLASNAVMKLNACEMRLGKTIQAIFLLNYFIYEYLRSPKTLIICPASLKFNWFLEIFQWYIGEEGFIIKGNVTKNKEIIAAYTANKPLIVSVDLLVANKRIRDLLMVFNYDKIFVDESQILRRTSTKRFDFFQNLVKQTKEVIFLTGTPKENSGEDCFIYFNTLLNLGGMDHLPDKNFMKQISASVGVWREIFCGFRSNKWGGGSHTGFRNTKLLEELWIDQAEQIFFRRTQEQVFKDSPGKVYNMRVFDVNLSDVVEEDEDYMAALQQFEKATGKGTPMVMQILRLLGELKATNPDVIGYLKDHLDSGAPLVLFVWHHSVINLLVEALSKYNPVLHHGQMSATEKHESILAFQKGKTNLIIGNVVSLGTGVDLSRAHDVKFLEYHFLATKNEQAAARTDGFKQKNLVFVEYISTNTPSEKRLINNMLSKHKIIEKTVDNISTGVVTMNNKKNI